MYEQAENCEFETSPVRESIESSPTAPAAFVGRWSAFAAGAMSVGAIWLIVLPIISDVPAVAEHISLQKQGNIDPSAMFYTDLAIAPAVADHAERIHAENLESFWGWPPQSPSL